jgi:hypothetical protein
MYGTNDGGNNWTNLNSFPAEDVLTIEIDNSGNIYVGSTNNYDYSTKGTLRKSTDFGSTWEVLLDNPRVADIEIDPANPDLIFIISQAWYLYLSGVENGVFYSDNGGTTWNDITYNLPNTFTTVLKQNPYNKSQLFVGTNGGGLFKLDDFVTSLREKSDVVPAGFELFQNYPNPFNPSTVISFSLTRPSVTLSRRERVVLRVFDVLGNEVAKLVYENLQPGYYEYTFNATYLSSGVYFASLTVGENIVVRKMVLLK